MRHIHTAQRGKLTSATIVYLAMSALLAFEIVALLAYRGIVG